MKRLLSACFVLAIIYASTLPASADTISDPFTGGINWSTWTSAVTSPSPATVVGINNRVEVTLGGLNMAYDPEPTTGAGLSYNPVVTGNFEATVDFDLLNWDPVLPRGLRVGIGADMIGAVERIGDPISPWNGNSYVVDFDTMGGGYGVTPALTYSGSLRLIRFADTIGGYYMDSTTNGAWVLIYEEEKLYAGPVKLSFGSWAHTEAASGRQVAFDNFTLTQHPVPEPATMLLLGSGLIGLIGYGRRRFKQST